MSRCPRVLVVDHFDSFVFVLADQFARLGAELRVFRSDLSPDDLDAAIDAFGPALVVLSPGPGRPEDAGVSVPWLRRERDVPVLGVCLGHQALAVAHGGTVERGEPVHGKPSSIALGDDPLFDGLPRRMHVARYHSLGVATVPSGFRTIATVASEPDNVMAIRNDDGSRIGLQFHPESFLTPYGSRLLHRILRRSVTR